MMNKNDSVVLGCLGLVAYIVILFVVGTALNAWTLKTLWAWFIVPTFESLPHLSIYQAAGVALVASFLTHQTSSEKPDDQKGIGEIIAKGIVYVVLKPAMSIFIGWIIINLFG